MFHIRKKQIVLKEHVYDFIKNHSTIFTIQTMCEILDISKSRYYDYINHKPSKHDLYEIELTNLIRDIWLDSSMRYGAPKIDAILRRNYGKTIGIKRIQRIMTQNDIKSIIVKKFKPTKYKPSSNIKRDNILKRDFNASRKNEKWVSDITYVWTKDDNWCYVEIQ